MKQQVKCCHLLALAFLLLGSSYHCNGNPVPNSDTNNDDDFLTFLSQLEDSPITEEPLEDTTSACWGPVCPPVSTTEQVRRTVPTSAPIPTTIMGSPWCPGGNCHHGSQTTQGPPTRSPPAPVSPTQSTRAPVPTMIGSPWCPGGNCHHGSQTTPGPPPPATMIGSPWCPGGYCHHGSQTTPGPPPRTTPVPIPTTVMGSPWWTTRTYYPNWQTTRQHP